MEMSCNGTDENYKCFINEALLKKLREEIEEQR